jgi:hypothetical protein
VFETNNPDANLAITDKKKTGEVTAHSYSMKMIYLPVLLSGESLKTIYRC